MYPQKRQYGARIVPECVEMGTDTCGSPNQGLIPPSPILKNTI